MDSKDVAKVPEWMWKEPPSVHKQLYTLLLRSTNNKPYPFLAQINPKSAEMLEVRRLILTNLPLQDSIIKKLLTLTCISKLNFVGLPNFYFNF